MVTMDLRTILIAILLIAVIVLVVYAIIMIRKLLATLERTNDILVDVKVVSDIAATRSKAIDGLVASVTDSVATVSDSIKGNGNATNAAVSVVNTLASLVGFFSRKKK